ncbi:MAG: hypothetical protein JWO72_2747 [Caulobacteraceae bacterium]|nr:hypothetical protein [Caulobacteraceae bacterium]
MLSVVLYGRNDSHGYNLHKRAAISLNAIAELLTDPDDEILFVDYNTPDDLPTFPEAIADTLTEKAVARLRILRVRPEVHRERFAARTHLAALEPIARNVAIRRSNPANRWILSTNTDMIFCPRAAGATLTSIVAGLADGFYHLPRFELPEGLWESLDRKDAPGVIASAREWGERFHLNEITFADRDNLYDAPGDFQLFLRQDLFDIDGFHEEMILGWHLDANVAKRMRLFRGKVSSALDHLIGYHCDHTRQSSPYHKADRTENDQVRFDDEVTAPGIPEQKDAWGLPDVQIEAFRLSEASAARYLKGLQASIPGPLSGFLETQYVLEDYGRMEYSADHVLPYLLDLVSCLPAETRIGYVGGRSDTWDKFLSGWSAMGGETVYLPQDVDWLDHGAPIVSRLPLAEWIDRADMFIFDVGPQDSTHHLNLTAQDSARLWQVDHAFKATIDRDQARQAAGAPARRVLIIGGVHNFFEPQVMPDVAVTLTPYSSRIRHGYIASRRAARVAGADLKRRAAMRSLQMLEPPSMAEIGRLGALLAAVVETAPDEAAWRDAVPVAAEIEALVAAGLIDGGAEPTELIGRLREARPSSLARRSQAMISSSAGQGAPSRLVRLEDWDDPDWAFVARRLFSNRDHALLLDREAWTWERVTLAQNLMKAAPAAGRPRILLVGKEPEILAPALAHQGYLVDIADPRALAAGNLASVDWRDTFLSHGWVSPEPIALIEDRAAQIEAGFRYAAVLLTQNSLFVTGRAGAADLLQAASGLLQPGGHLGFAALAQPLVDDERRQEHALPHALTADGALGQALQALTDLAPDGAVDSRVTPRSLDRSCGQGGARAGAPPPLMVGTPPQLDVPGVWALGKTANACNWPAFKAVLDLGVYGAAAAGEGAQAVGGAGGVFTVTDLAQAPAAEGLSHMGSRFDVLNPTPGLTKTPAGMHIPASFGDRVAAAAPLGRIAAGSYEVDVEVAISSLSEPGPVLVLAVVSKGRLLSEHVLEAEASGAGRLVAPLEIGAEGWQGVSILLKAQGRADFDILNLALR